MKLLELQVETRKVLGKKVRFLRRQGVIPANVFGHNVASCAVQVDAGLLRQVLSRAGRTRLISLNLDNTESPQMVLVRGVQRDPLTGKLLHVDFYQVKMTEKITAEVPLILKGESPAEKLHKGTLLQELLTMEIECLPADLPSHLEVDVSVLAEIDQAIHARDIPLPSGVILVIAPDRMVARIEAIRAEAEEAKPAAKAVVEAAPAAAKKEAARSEEK